MYEVKVNSPLTSQLIVEKLSEGCCVSHKGFCFEVEMVQMVKLKALDTGLDILKKHMHNYKKKI